MARTSQYANWFAGAMLLIGLVTIQCVSAARFEALCRTRAAEVMPAADGQKAEDELKKAVAIEPSLGLAHWLLSKEYFRRAVIASNIVSKLKERFAAAQQEQPAAAVQLLERYKAAESIRNELLERAKESALKGTRTCNSIEWCKQIASIYLELGEKAEAERYFKVLLQLRPNDVVIAEQLGLVYLHAGKYEDLLALCDVILRSQPYNANAFYYRAFAADKRGDSAEMQRNLLQAYYSMIQNDTRIYFDPKQILDRLENLGMIPTGRSGSQ